MVSNAATASPTVMPENGPIVESSIAVCKSRERYNSFCKLSRPPFDRSHQTGATLLEFYSDYQKSVPIKLASLLNLIAIGCCFDSLSRIYSGLQKLLYRSRLLQTAI